MKNLLIITFVTLAITARAGILEELYLPVLLKSSELDESLSDKQSKFTFEFNLLDSSRDKMIYSIDGKEGKATLVNQSIEILTTPGKHIFQFFYSEDYYEVYSDSLEIKNKFHSVYEVYMERSDVIITVDKPVIYLYPEDKTEVTVDLNIVGEPTFMYPKYDNGWKCIALPSGEISIGENTYNYLFWEAAQRREFSSEEMKSGFNVKKENVIAFLEEKLDQAGLNSKEQADFITYWGPRLVANDLNFIHFEFNEECNRYAQINIDPKPTSVYRIYMTWMPIESELIAQPQAIPTYTRNGFTVLEWGGAEIKQQPQFP